MRYKAVWIGVLISIGIFLIGLLLSWITGGQFQPISWTETSSIGKFLLYASVVLLIPSFIVGFLFWGCASIYCKIIAMIVTLIIYALIGALIGYVIGKIKRRK